MSAGGGIEPAAPCHGVGGDAHPVFPMPLGPYGSKYGTCRKESPVNVTLKFSGYGK